MIAVTLLEIQSPMEAPFARGEAFELRARKLGFSSRDEGGSTLNRWAIVIVAAAAAVIAAAGRASASTSSTSAVSIPKASGAKMCVLTQADFKPFGTLVGSKVQANIDQDGANVYCVYRGVSGAKGGVELDVFYPAGETPADIEQTFKTVLASDPGATYTPENVLGADESVYSLSVPSPGYFPFAANAVRRGALVFTLSLPSSPMSKNEMLKLSEIVLERLAK
jgi:hypothetical protein